MSTLRSQRRAQAQREAFYRLSLYQKPLNRVSLHGLGALIVGLTLLLEDPLGYTVKVFDGPKGLLEFLPGNPMVVWAWLLMICGFFIIRGKGGKCSIAPLVAVSVVWMMFGCSAMYVGITEEAAGTFGGEVTVMVAIGAVMRALEIAYWVGIRTDDE